MQVICTKLTLIACINELPFYGEIKMYIILYRLNHCCDGPAVILLCAHVVSLRFLCRDCVCMCVFVLSKGEIKFHICKLFWLIWLLMDNFTRCGRFIFFQRFLFALCMHAAEGLRGRPRIRGRGQKHSFRLVAGLIRKLPVGPVEWQSESGCQSQLCVPRQPYSKEHHEYVVWKLWRRSSLLMILDDIIHV